MSLCGETAKNHYREEKRDGPGSRDFDLAAPLQQFGKPGRSVLHQASELSTKSNLFHYRSPGPADSSTRASTLSTCDGVRPSGTPARVSATLRNSSATSHRRAWS